MKSLRQYEIIIEIARWGSISKAADSLKVSQPTVSKLLQKLETEMDIELFDRTTIPIRLTAAGERYVEAGRKILDADHQFIKELDEIKNHRNGSVKIGISPSRARYLIPEVVAEYRNISQIESRILIRERTTGQLNTELMRGDLDMIISLASAGTSGFLNVPLFRETTVLAVPVWCSDNDALTILKTIPMIGFNTGQRMWKVVDDILEDAGGEKPSIECQTFESALELVRKGLGITLVPSYMAGYNDDVTVDKVVFMRLPDNLYKKFASVLERQVCLFYRKEQFLTSSENAFIDACTRVISRVQTEQKYKG